MGGFWKQDRPCFFFYLCFLPLRPFGRTEEARDVRAVFGSASRPLLIIRLEKVVPLFWLVFVTAYFAVKACASACPFFRRSVRRCRALKLRLVKAQ